MKYNVGDRVNYMVQERIEAHGSYKREDNTSIQIERPDGFYEWIDKWRVIPPELPATQPADDKEYREFVETEALINLSEVLEKAQTDKWRGEQLNDSYLINSATKRIKYYTRLMADIKKGVGL